MPFYSSMRCNSVPLSTTLPPKWRTAALRCNWWKQDGGLLSGCVHCWLRPLALAPTRLQ